MIKARWQGFNVESGENPAPLIVTHWYVLKQALIFSLFGLPFLTGVGVWLAQRLLKPVDWPVALTKGEPLTPSKETEMS